MGKKALIWAGVLAVIGGLAYGVSNSSGVRYTDRDLDVVDFSLLNAEQKKTALIAANAARCACGCGLTLAGCIVTDSTCPIRATNIERVQKIVADARQ